MKRTRSNLFLLAAGLVAGIFIPAAHAANGTWSTDIAGNWSDTTKWTGATVADGIGSIADFSTLNITAGRTVTIDTTSRTVGTIKFGDTGATADSAWTLAAAGGATLTLATGTAVQPVIDMGSTGIAGNLVQHTVSAPLVGTAGFNLTGSNQLVFNDNTLNGISGTATITAGRMAIQSTQLGGLTAIDVKSGGQLGLWNAGTYNQNISIAGTGNGETGFEAALRVANAGATVTLAGGITLTGNATIGGRNVAGTGGTIFNGVIGESGGSNLLTFGTSGLSTATYALNGANTYSGGTTIAFGTVLAGNNLALGTGAVTVNSGAILNANGSTLANATTLVGGTLTNSSATAGAVGGVTLSAGRLSTVSTTGTGTLALGAITREPSAFVNFTNTTANTIATTTGSASTVLTDATTGAAYATFGGTDWAAKDATNTYVVSLTSIGGYSTLTAAGFGGTLSGNADLTGAGGTYTLTAASAPVTIRNLVTGNTLALGGQTLSTRGVLSSQNLTISGTGSLQSAVAGGDLLVNQSANTTVINSVIADNTTASSLVKTGAGTVTLSGGANVSHTYTGLTYVTQGTLQLGNNFIGSLATSGIVVSSGATFNLADGTLTATQNITGAGNFQVGAGFIGGAIAGTLAGTNNTYTGTTSANVNLFTLAAGGVINGTSSVTVAGGNAATLMNNGSITTIGAVTVNGGNTTNAGLFTNGNAGGTTPGIVNAASLTLGAANTQASGTAHGGAFTNNLNSTVTVPGGLTVNGQGSATALITSSATGSLFTNAGGTVTSTGTITLNSSVVGNTVSNKGGTYTQTAGTTTAAALNLTESGAVIATGTAGNDAAFNLSGGSATFGSATLTGTTTVSGTGTLNVSGSFFTGEGASHSGTFIQTGGTTNLTATAALSIRLGHWDGGTGISTVAVSGGVFNATGTTVNLGYDGNAALTVSGTGVANLKGLVSGRTVTKTDTVTLTGGRLNIGTGGIAKDQATTTINLGGGTVGAFGGNWSSSLAMTLTDAVNGTTFNTLDSANLSTGRTITLSGVISGAGALVKTGAGTLTLSGANDYTGSTTVSGGTLLINGSLGATAVTVGSGATLGGSGIIGGPLNFDAGANLNIVDIADALAISGSVTFDGFGFSNITGWDYANAANGTYTLLAGGNFDLTNVSNVGAANPFDLGGGRSAYFQNGSLQVVVIPEPTVALLGGLGMLTLLRRRRGA